MEKRTLGRTDIQVPAICLGTMNWGQQNTEAEAHEQLDYAVDERGVYFIDTAEIYPIPPTPELQGTTERFVGSWLKKRGKRDDLVLATKVAAAGFIRTRDVGDTPHLDRASIREAIEGSLSRLGTDYVDLYQIHWPERSTNFFGVRGYKHNAEETTTPILETLEALGELVKEGKVRHIGLSNETPWGVAEYLRLAEKENLPRIVSIQNQYSVINREFEAGLAEFAMREQVGLLAYSSLSGGVLSGKYLGGQQPAGARFTLTERNRDRYNRESLQEVIQAYVDLATKHGLDPVQMALAFVTGREFTTSTIIGATSVEQLKTCIDSGEMTLSEEVLADIEALHERYPNHQV